MQLNLCNKCWSDAEYYRVADTVFWGCSNEVCNSTPAISVDRGVVHHEIINGYYWQEANPISAAGKMLLKYRVAFLTGSKKTNCKECDAFYGFDTHRRRATIQEAIQHQHFPTCPLITEAKLPLKVKDNDTP